MGMGESKKHPKGLGGTSLTKKFRMGREQGDKVLVWVWQPSHPPAVS